MNHLFASLLEENAAHFNDDVLNQLQAVARRTLGDDADQIQLAVQGVPGQDWRLRISGPDHLKRPLADALGAVLPS